VAKERRAAAEWRPVRLWVVVLVALCLAVPAGGAQTGPDTSSYQGLGTWVDLWDGPVWAKPEAAVARMSDLGVTTLYIETSNYSQRVDLVRQTDLGRFVDAAHANGLRVIAWYLPSFRNLARDVRRSLAAVRFRSAQGESFDSFALDIEAKVVPSAAERSARLLALSARLRAAVGNLYPLGAIIPSPRGMDLNPRYWPGFPYEGLTKSYDVFLPMGYFTYRVKTAAGSRAYSAANVALLRERAGDEGLQVHSVGGLAGAATVAEVRAFATAAADQGALGASLYDYATTGPAQWQALSAAAG
jgi:hypothetical protein